MLLTLVESDFGVYIEQVGSGIALGAFQIEPTTYNDTIENYLEYKKELKIKILNILGRDSFPKAEELKWNLKLSVIFARLKYYRVKEKIPSKNNLLDIAKYYKLYYNSNKGAAKVEEVIKKYNRWN